MTVNDEISTFLINRPGYLKWSSKKILKKLDLPRTPENEKLAQTIKYNLRHPMGGGRANNMKILVFDIETGPLISYHWRHWQQNLYSDQRIEDNWPVLTWSAKWLFEDKMYSDKMTPEEALHRDDQRVCQSLWHLLEEADVVIAHNGLKFDMRMMNGRFFIHGMTPTSSVRVIDTLRAAKRALALPSYKLDDIAKYLGKPGKIKTDFSWWSEFMEGNPEAIDKMQEYNDKDVYVLEEVYFDMRPWIKPHPNLGLFTQGTDPACPACGDDTSLALVGEYATYVNTFDEFRCGNCGHISRKRTSNTPIAGKKALQVSVPN